MQATIADVLPSQAKTFIRPQPAIHKQRGGVSQQKRIFGSDRFVATHCGAYAGQSTSIGILDFISDSSGPFEITGLLLG